MRYILLIIAIMGGLLSFNSNAALINQCSISAPPVYGSYTYFLSGGSMHIDLDGCDYFSHDNLVLVNEDVPSGSPISHEGNWYPSGKKSNEVAHDKPFTSSLSQQTDQLNRYCAQSRKCDSKGIPVNISDWLKFKEKDDAEHKNPSEKPGDKPSDADKPGSGSSGDSGSSSGDGSTPAGSGTGTPDGTDIGSGTISGSTDGSTSGSSSGSSTPSPSQPEKPYPSNPVASHLLDSFYSCEVKVSFLGDSVSDSAYNSAARNCNAILKNLSSVLLVGEINAPTGDNFKFLTRNESGTVFDCHATTDDDRQAILDKGYPSYMIPDVLGHRVFSIDYRTNDLNFNYGRHDSGNNYCNSVYEKYVESHNKHPDAGNESSDADFGDSGSAGASTDKSSSCPSGQFNIPGQGCMLVQCPQGQHPVAGATSADFPLCLDDGDSGGKPDICPSGSHHEPGTLSGSCTTDFNLNPGVGSGSGNADSNDNGDVVAAINAFHADANRNHKETMNKLDVSEGDVQGIKHGLSSDIHELVTSTKKELTDSYNDAMAELKDVFGDIDSYVPDIKLSFDLPTQFTAGIMGRCVPLVFDFNISLVGLPSYHLHAEGVQACKLYDLYVRSIVEYMLYFMTALACRRVFTRAAEFITSQP